MGSLVENVARLVESITQACDFSMPKSRPHSRRAAYWWTEEIASLRRSFVEAKRLHKRAQRRGDEAWKAEALSDYRSA